MWTSAVFLAAAFAAGAARADGIATSFVDVAVLDVPMGKPRTILDPQGQGLVLHNHSDEAVAVHVQVLRPNEPQLRGHAKAIPDPSWISVSPAHLFLPPRSSAACELVVLVPKGRAHRGRVYQAMIWTKARPVARKGIAVSVGLLSRLRLQVER